MPAAAPGDPDQTWDPSQGDPFESLLEPPAGRESTGGGRESTGLPPLSTGKLREIWGDSFDDVDAGMTLKGPAGGTKELRVSGSDPSTARTWKQPKRPLTAGTRIPDNLELDGYELLEVLGEGGVGVVYQAVQKSIDRRIAVKMIRPDVARNTDERSKFLSEAIVTGRLDHPNIVPIHDLGRTADGQPFYVMKMVRGTPWSAVLRERPQAENLRVLLGVCDAIAFAHAKRVIHRDLKPDNVMLGEFGEVQLMDWGLGTTVDEHGHASQLTPDQAAGGTPSYMAPEMVTGEDGPVGIHSDVYLLGAILYQIVTGRPPHAGRRVMNCLENALHNIIQATDQTGVLVDIALRAMQTKPADRYPSVRAFRDAIIEYQTHAESINLCERSSLQLHRANTEEDYELFAQALFGFREALTLWTENEDAQSGIMLTQLQYARCALRKGDLDLAASTLDPEIEGHRALLEDVNAAQARRDTARKRLRLFRGIALGLTAAVIVILTGASIWISIAKSQAVRAKEAAVLAQQAEAEQRRVAESARAKAQAEEQRAVQALEDLQRAVQAMNAAQTAEEKAVAKQRAAELVATETRDELARTGMLMDNTWWVFDAAAAQRRQRAAAAELGRPVDLQLALGDAATLDLVLIPAGEFVMGSPPREAHRAADEYLHRVRLTRPFYLAQFELTRGQWQALLGELPQSEGAETGQAPSLPVTGFTYEQLAAELLPALQAHAPDGWRFCLPTEAQWEYACRAGQWTAFHSGDDETALSPVGWYLSNSERAVQPVGQKAPNAFGLYDMHGNVGEMCADQFDPGFYLEAPTDDPLCVPHSGAPVDRPVVRGGSVFNTPEHCRAAYRSYIYRKNLYEFVGVRVALVED